MLICLEAVALLPVIELEPGRYSKHERPLPQGRGKELPLEWRRYWLDSPADSGITGLTPLMGSWHVPTQQFTDPAVIERVLIAEMEAYRDAVTVADLDEGVILDGGFALCEGDRVMRKPTCCGDLGNLSERRKAARYRGTEWQQVWIGHPWISARFDDGWSVLSEIHEGEPPVGRYAVRPDDLERAIVTAEAELEYLSRRLRPVLSGLVGDDRATYLSRMLAGLWEWTGPSQAGEGDGSDGGQAVGSFANASRSARGQG